MAIVLQDEACTSMAMALLYHGGFHSLQLQRVAHALWMAGEVSAAVRIQVRGCGIPPRPDTGETLLGRQGYAVCFQANGKFSHPHLAGFWPSNSSECFLSVLCAHVRWLI